MMNKGISYVLGQGKMLKKHNDIARSTYTFPESEVWDLLVTPGSHNVAPVCNSKYEVYNYNHHKSVERVFSCFADSNISHLRSLLTVRLVAN